MKLDDAKRIAGERMPLFADFLQNMRWLFKKEKSQFGEELLLKELLMHNHILTYLDIGCYQPITWSNSFYLERQGLKGIHIDANPKLRFMWKLFRRRSIYMNLGITPQTSKSLNKLEYHVFPRRWGVLNTFSNIEAEKWELNLGVKSTRIEVPLASIQEVLKLCTGMLGTVDLLLMDIEGLDSEIAKE